MSATDLLFDPIFKTQPVPSNGTGISRGAEWMTVEIHLDNPRCNYVFAAAEIMDAVITRHAAITELIDVRKEPNTPPGALHLSALVNLYYDGQEEIWICSPEHMPPDLMRFRGRFGFANVCTLPVDHGPMYKVCWSWIETNAGFLQAFDIGLVMVPVTKNRSLRIFNNKKEATSYYAS